MPIVQVFLVGKICIGAHGLCDRSVFRSVFFFNAFIHCQSDIFISECAFFGRCLCHMCVYEHWTHWQLIVLLLPTGYRSPAKLFVNACVTNNVHNMPNLCVQWSAQTFHEYFSVHYWRIHHSVQMECARWRPIEMRWRREPNTRCTRWGPNETGCPAVVVQLGKIHLILIFFFFEVMFVFVSITHYNLIGRLTSATQQPK